MIGDTSNITSTLARLDSMYSLVFISENSAEWAFKLASGLYVDWLVDCSYDLAAELRSLDADGFLTDLTSGELAQVESEVRFRAGSVQRGQLMLRQVRPIELAVRAVEAWLRNNGDVGCMLTADLRMDLVRPVVEAVERRYGFAVAGLVLQQAPAKIAEAAAVSIWPRYPDTDFDHNTLVLFRDQPSLGEAEAACVAQGIIRCNSYRDAVLAWKRKPSCATCYIGPVELT